MTPERVILLDHVQTAALADLRLHSEVRVLPTAEGIWLRGRFAVDDLQFKALPRLADFELLNKHSLVPLGSQLPVRELPQGEWQAIQQFFQLAVPVHASPGQASTISSKRLQRSGTERSVNAVLSKLTQLQAWIRTAPKLRIERLAWVICEDQRVFVIGTPLPGIAGQHYTIADGIALPAGMQLPNYLPAAVLAMQLKLHKGDIALFNADGSWEYIAAVMLTDLERAGVLRTWAEAQS